MSPSLHLLMGFTLALVAASPAAHKTTQAGFNCTKDACDDEQPPCPPDSILDPATSSCVCSPAHCTSLQICHYRAKRVLQHKATNQPGDCCDVYECVEPAELNCSQVDCPAKDTECPEDSYRLPNIRSDDECCSIPQGCACLPEACPTPKCPPGTRAEVTKKGIKVPGSCCNEYICIPQVGTTDSTPGGCKSSSGVIYEIGAEWQDDDCTHCVCINGKSKCQSTMCIHTCDNATYVKGECCPRCNGISMVTVPPNCPSMDNCTIKCKYGLMRDSSNCFTCECDDKKCDLDCPYGLAKDDDGNDLCQCLPNHNCPKLSKCTKKCKHGFKLNKDGCEVCKCDHCSPIPDCRKKCPHGLEVNNRGCPYCKCKPPPTFEGGKNETRCISGSTSRDEGEAWFDGCRQCYCLGGKEMCALVSCPVPQCSSPVLPSPGSRNSCCPICPGNATVAGSHVVCYGPGGVKLEGERWKDGCVECICHSGRVLCYSEPCPPTACPRPLPPQQGECCSTCSPEDTLVGLEYGEPCDDRPAGTSWREGNCKSCICVDGTASCYTEMCDQRDGTCKTPGLVKNQCCPICFDGKRDMLDGCVSGNQTYHLGQIWEPDKCVRCTCESSRSITCTKTLCENGCSKHPNDPCCPLCLTGGDGNSSDGISWWIPLTIFCLVGSLLTALLYYSCTKKHQLKLTDCTKLHHDKFISTYEPRQDSLSKPERGQV